MLDGRRFAIFTDHKPLTYALARVSEPWTARQTRQLSYVAEYTSDIRHIAGAANVVADTLSRPPGRAAADRTVVTPHPASLVVGEGAPAALSHTTGETKLFRSTIQNRYHLFSFIFVTFYKNYRKFSRFFNSRRFTTWRFTKIQYKR